MPVKQPGRRVLLIGHYGGSNTGDEAMLQSLLFALPSILEVTVLMKAAQVLFSTNRPVRVVGMNAASVLRAILTTDILLLGGGTHFHDDYRGMRLTRHYRYMLRYVVVFAIAKVLRKKVFCLGMGVGPLRNWTSRFITRCALALSNGVSVRDQASLDEAISLGAGKKTLLAFDLTALKYAQRDSEKNSDERRWLAVSITDIPGNDGENISRDKLIDTLSQGIGRLLSSQPGTHVKVVVVRGGDRESDVELSEQLVAALRQYADRVRLIPYSDDPADLVAELRGSYGACVMRYHAAVLAYLAGCRVLLLPYHRKLSDLRYEIGLPETACPTISSLTELSLANHLSSLMLENSRDYTPSLPLGAAHDLALKNLSALNL